VLLRGAVGAQGSAAACPWQRGVRPQLLPPPCIIMCPCFLLVSRCQGEPGRFGEPGDPGEDVSRRHMGGQGGGCCRQQMLLWRGPCPHHPLPSPSWWLGVFTGSQGVLRSQRGEGKCLLVPGEWGAPQRCGGPLRVARCPARGHAT